MYDVSADRKRFLMIKETSVADERPLYLPIRPGTCSDRESVKVLLPALSTAIRSRRTDVRESDVVISVEHKASHFVHSHFCMRAQ